MIRHCPTHHVILLVEGRNERIFYGGLIDFLREEKRIGEEVEVAIRSVDGLPRFQSKAKGILKDFAFNNDGRIDAFLCYDSDALKEHGLTSQKMKDLLGALTGFLDGRGSVKTIVAEPNLERFFLEDPEALSRFLGIKAEFCRTNPARGLRGIQELFRKAGRYYAKKSAKIEKLVSLYNFEGFIRLNSKLLNRLLVSLKG